jgi:hypothetical protein
LSEQRNLFIIETEYHLMASISIIFSGHSSSNQKNVIVAIQDPKRRRLPENLRKRDHGLEYHDIGVNQSKIKAHPGVGEKLKKLLSNDYASCYLFLEHLPLERFLAAILKSKGTCIHLLPDGTKPYLKRSHISILDRMKRSLRNILWLHKNGIRPQPLTLISGQYGGSGFIQRIWLTYLGCFEGNRKLPISQFGLLGSDESRNWINNIYQEDLDKMSTSKDGIILHVNNIYFARDAEKLEVELLTQICRNTDRPVYMKLHPHTPKEHLDDLERIDGLTLIRSSIPVELLIMNLTNSVVLSFWSAGLFIKNDNCEFFWLHPIMEKFSLLPDGFEVRNPTEHIREVDNIEVILSHLKLSNEIEDS